MKKSEKKVKILQKITKKCEKSTKIDQNRPKALKPAQNPQKPPKIRKIGTISFEDAWESVHFPARMTVYLEEPPWGVPGPHFSGFLRFFQDF